MTRVDDRTVAIVGMGTGGFYCAGLLGIAGFKIRIHDINEAKLKEIKNRGGIEVEGDPGGFSSIEVATTDLARAIDGAGIILITTGGHRQASAAKALSPILADGQIVLLIQGNTGGSLAFRKVLTESGCKAQIDVAEMDNYPFSAPLLGPTKMRSKVTKQWLQIASFPGRNIGSVFPRLAPLFPTAVAADTVISTGFTNANAVLHVANCIANAGKIDRGEQYRFYAEGATPMVARVYQKVSEECVRIAAAFGAKVPSLPEWIEKVYGVREPQFVDTFNVLTFGKPGPYFMTPTPKSFEANFVAEDVPVGLMPMSALGAVAGIDTPTITALVNLAKAMTGRTYEEDARTLERMGLAGLDVKGIRKVVEQGFK